MPPTWLQRSLVLPVGSKFGGMSVSDAKRLKELEAENTRLKKLLAEQMFRKRRHQGRAAKKAVTALVRRALGAGDDRSRSQ